MARTLKEQLTALAERYEARIQAIRVTILALDDEDRMKAVVALPGKLRTAVRQRDGGETTQQKNTRRMSELRAPFQEILAKHAGKKVKAQVISEELARSQGVEITRYQLTALFKEAGYRPRGHAWKAYWLKPATKAAKNVAPVKAAPADSARSQSDAPPLGARGAMKEIMLAVFPGKGASLSREEIGKVVAGSPMQVGATLGALVRRGYLRRKGDNFVRTAFQNGAATAADSASV